MNNSIRRGVAMGAMALLGVVGCGRPSGSFVPYSVAITAAGPADQAPVVAIMNNLAQARGFHLSARETLPPGFHFLATHEELCVIMGAHTVAGRLNIQVTAMAPKLDLNAPRRDLLAELDRELRAAFGDRLVEN
jgi:hypothetical protein